MPGRGDCGGGEVLQRGAAGENMESTTRSGLVEESALSALGR